MTDNFRFKNHAIKNHAIKNPTETQAKVVVKATQALDLTMQANNYAPSYELEAITNLQALHLVINNNGTTKDKTVEPVNARTPINNAQPSQETALIPTKDQLEIQNTRIRPTLTRYHFTGRCRRHTKLL